jgi:hypothetical protein
MFRRPTQYKENSDRCCVLLSTTLPCPQAFSPHLRQLHAGAGPIDYGSSATDHILCVRSLKHKTSKNIKATKTEPATHGVVGVGRLTRHVRPLPRIFLSRASYMTRPGPCCATAPVIAASPRHNSTSAATMAIITPNPVGPTPFAHAIARACTAVATTPRAPAPAAARSHRGSRAALPPPPPRVASTPPPAPAETAARAAAAAAAAMRLSRVRIAACSDAHFAARRPVRLPTLIRRQPLTAPLTGRTRAITQMKHDKSRVQL